MMYLSFKCDDLESTLQNGGRHLFGVNIGNSKPLCISEYDVYGGGQMRLSNA